MTTETIRGYTQILDNSITEPKLYIVNAPASGQHLTWDGTDLKWQHNLATASILYLHNEVADVAGYEKLLPVPANGAEDADTAVANSGSGEVLLDDYITDQLGVSILDGGLWEFNSYTKVDSATGVTQIVIRVYKRNTVGTETELFNVTTAEINSLATILIQTTTIQPDFSINITDRLVVKYYAKTTSVTNRTVTLYYEGTTNYSHIHTPFGAVIGSFLTLDDTPDSYSTFAHYVPSVKADETGLEFAYPLSSGGGVSSVVLTNAAGEGRFGGSVYVGPGTDSTFQAYSGIFIHENGNAQISVRDDTDNIEGGLFAHVGGNVYAGSWTNHPFILRSNNTNTLTIDGGDVYSAAWADYSATSTIVGWSSFTTKSIYYKKVGKLVFVTFNLQGASNSVNTTFTLPYSANSGVATQFTARCTDNSVGQTNAALGVLNASSSTVTMYKDLTANTWTAGNNKSVIGEFWYESA